ncbi:MAG: hypothetical protein WCF67_21100, partial [Chitinophagaceae bacterium]
MKPELKAIATEIIAYHRSDQGGIFKWSRYIWQHRNTPGMYPLSIAARDFLIGNAFIKFFIPGKVDVTQLTDKGWEWKGFHAEQIEKDRKEKEARRINWPQRNWMWVALIGFFAGIFSEVFT